MADEIERLNACAEKLGVKARYGRAQMNEQLRDVVPIIEALTNRLVRREKRSLLAEQPKLTKRPIQLGKRRK